jgi:hypothetical protein
MHFEKYVTQGTTLSPAIIVLRVFLGCASTGYCLLNKENMALVPSKTIRQL